VSLESITVERFQAFHPLAPLMATFAGKNQTWQRIDGLWITRGNLDCYCCRSEAARPIVDPGRMPGCESRSEESFHSQRSSKSVSNQYCLSCSSEQRTFIPSTANTVSVDPPGSLLKTSSPCLNVSTSSSLSP